MDEGGMQEISWGDEIPFEDFADGNYVVPKAFCELQRSMWLGISKQEVYTTPLPKSQVG